MGQWMDYCLGDDCVIFLFSILYFFVFLVVFLLFAALQSRNLDFFFVL